MGSLDKKDQQVCKVEVLSGGNAPDIEEEINNKLKEDGITKTSSLRLTKSISYS